jgi:uncharacterized repeat protein (TIGR01451 family)
MKTILFQRVKQLPRRAGLAVLLSLGGWLLAPDAMAVPPLLQTYYIPLPETHSYSMFSAINSATTTNIVNVISIAANSTNTIIVWDHFEDGYEADLANPVQPTTQIWGDNNPANGIPPGFSNDIINAGTVLALRSTVPVPHNPANILFDGQDRFAATRAVAVTYASWPLSPGAVLADAIEVTDTTKWGTNYISPVGTNTAAASQFFEYAALSIMAGDAGTVVRVDRDANGTFELTNTLNAGQAWLVSTGILAGAQVTASKPVQVALLTGDINSSYEARWFSLTPVEDWCYCGIVPVTTTDAGDPLNIFLYNQYTHSITVDVSLVSGSTSFTVTPKSVYRYAVPAGSGPQMLIRGQNETNPTLFYTAIGIMDATDPSGNNSDHDWGFTVPTLRSLSPQVLVGWGPGADTNSGSYTGTQNGSPVWVVARSNTTLYVDYDGNPATGPLVDPNGNRYNFTTNVLAFQSIRIYDPDGDQTGMRIYSLNNTPISAAWGQDPSVAAAGNPFLDMGTTVPALASFDGSKTYSAVGGDGDGRIEPGETIEYALTLVNGSFQAIESVSVLDALPPNVTYVPNSTTVNGLPIPDDGSGTPFPLDAPGYTNLPDLVSFSNVVVTFRVILDNPFPTNVSTFTNLATFYTASGDLVVRSETPVVQADLELTKSVNNPTPYVGSNVVFTITVTNRGPNVAEEVVVRDALPAGLNYVSHSGGAYVSGTGLWTIGTLAVGGSTNLQITATVTGGNPITNVAQVYTAGVFDPDSTPGNEDGPPYEDDEDDAVITPVPQIDLELRKTANTLTPNVGGNVTFTIAVTNRGPSDATGVTVLDLLPAGLSYVSHSGGSYVPGTGIWTIGALAVGGSTNLQITAAVTNSGNIQNTAQVQTANETDVDSIPGNNVPSEDDQDSVTLSVPAAIDLELTKSVNNPTPNVGGTIVYTLVLTNKGPNNATGVTVQDTLPAGVGYVSHTGPGTYVAGTGVWTIGGPMTPGSSRILQITATVTGSGTITNFAQVQTADQYDVDSTPGNAPPYTEDDDDLVVITVAPAADLELTKDVNNSTPNVGQSVVFTIGVTNRGPDNATGVTVRDILPSGLAYVSHSGGAYVPGTGIWTIGALAVGGSTNLQITAAVTNSGNIDNIAQVWTADQFDIDSTPGNSVPSEDDQDNAALTVPAAIDLELAKSVNNPTPSVGGTIVYTLVLTNKGPNNATGVTVQDALPAGVGYVSHTGPGTYVAGTGVWTIGGPMTPGSSRILQITATVTGSGTITNFAQVQTADQYDVDSTPGNAPPYTEDDDDLVVITVAPAADLELTKDVNNSTPNVGQSVVFTIGVTNRGPDNATGVTVRDILPSGLAYVSHSGGAYVPGTGIWTIGALAVGGSTNLQITAAVTNSGNIDNIAQVWTADQFDIDSTPGNSVPSEDDQDNAALTVPAAIDLELTKSVNNPTPNVGGTIVYTLVLTNKGPNNATGVTVQDTLPAGVGYVSHTGPGTYVAGTGVWTIGGPMTPGSSRILQITATVTGSGTITNFAQVQTADQYDVDSTPGNAPPYTEDDDDLVVITVAPAADLELTKDVNNSTPNVGQSVVFTIGVTNRGPDNATGVTVRDILPSGLAYVSHSGGAYVPGTGIWTIGALAVGGSTNLQITAAVTNSGNIDNIAQVWTADQFDIDSTPGNSVPSEDDQDNAALQVPTAGDLELAKSVDDPAPNVGDSIVFTVVVTNRGPNAQQSVTVLDALPAGLSYAGHAGGLYNPGTGIWSIGNLGVNASTSLTITATVTASGVLTNFAQIQTALHFDIDSTPGNAPPYVEDDDDFVVVNVPPAADLELRKDVDTGNPNLFDDVTFTITVTNRGPDNATGVTVADVLPAGLAYVSHGGGVYDSGTGIWSIGNLAVGGTATLTITATVNDTGVITNTAQVATANEYDPDSTPGNNVPTEDDQDNALVSVGEAADLSLVKSVDDPVPNVGESIAYTIVITNSGPDNATGVAVRDLLPAGLSYDGHAGGTYNSGTGIWDVGNLNVGASATLVIDATVVAAGTFTNIAQVSASDQYDPDSTPDNDDPAEDDQDEAVINTPQADLELTKVVDNATPNVTDDVTFTITVTNRGPDNATSVTVADALPAGLAYVSHSGGTYDSGTGLWDIGNLDVGGSASLQITATVTNSGIIDNIAQVATADQYDPDSTPGNDVPSEDDQDNATLNVPPASDLELTKNVDNPTPAAGQNVLFTITLTNQGPDEGEGISVRDVLPAGLAYVSHANGAYTPGTGIWNIGDLVVGASTSLTITAQVTVDGIYTNVAQVWTSDHFDPDSTPANEDGPPYEDDEDEAVVTASPVIDLEVAKTVDKAQADPFENVVWTVVVTNRGPSTATGVTIYDPLPTNWVYVSDSSGAYDTNTAIWTIGTLPAGGSTSLAITAYATLGVSVMGHGPVPPGYTNVAQVWTANEPDIDSTPGNSDPAEDDQDDAFIPIRALSDLALTKTVDNPTPYVGSQIAYTIVVTNEGPQPAVGVRVEDILPAGLTYVSNSVGAAYSPVSGIWDIGLMVQGWSRTLTIWATVDVPGLITNVAQVNRNEHYDPDSTPDNDDPTEDDQDEVVINGRPLVDVELDKSVDKAEADPFEHVVWTVVVTNKGPSAATGLTVYDELPVNWVYVSDSSGAYDTNTAIWTIGTLPAGGSTSLAITAYATLGVSVMGHGPVPPAYTNVAQVWTLNEDDVDSIPGNSDPTEDDQDYATIPITALSDLALTKTVDNPTPYVGQQIAYTIVVTNEGPQPAAGVLIEDILPAGLTYVSNSVGAAYSPVSGIWDIGLMVQGWSRTLTIWATVDVPGLITNVAQVNRNEHFDPDSTPDNDEPTEDDQDEVVINGRPLVDVELDKTVDKAEADPFENVVWTIVVTNKGPSAATGLTVYDELPVNWVYVSDSSGAYDTNTAIWTIGTLPAGGSTSLAITAYATLGVSVMGHGPVPPAYTNVAQVWTLNEDDVDSIPGNSDPTEDDQDYATIPIVALSDLALTKTVDDPTPNVGQQIAYTIVVTNEGPQPAAGVLIEDILPAGLTYVSNSVGAAYSPVTGIWDIGLMVQGWSRTLTIWAVVDSPNVITNIAQVNRNEHFDPDSTPDNDDPAEDDQDEAVITPQQADLSLTKDGPEYVVAGGTATFTIEVFNDGPDPATGVTVEDVLPAGLVYDSHSGGDYDAGTGVWTIGGLGVGSSTNLQISVTVGAVGVYTNVAQIRTSDQYDPDSTPGNEDGPPYEDDEDEAEVTVVQPSVSIVKTAGDTPDGGIRYVAPGSEVVYAYEVTNDGDTDLDDVEVTDDILGFIGSIPGPLGVGASATLYATSTIPASVTNIGTVVATPVGGSSGDPLGLPDVTDDDDAVVLVAFLGIEKEDTPDPVRPGEALTYTLWIGNPSDHPVQNVVVTETYPVEFSYVNAVPPPTAGNNVWDLGDLDPGELQVIVVHGVVAPGTPDGTILTNRIEVVSNVGTNVVEEPTRVVDPPPPGRAAIRITKRDLMDPVAPGGSLSYVLRVENHGPDTATNVVATDTYDPLFAYDSAVPAPSSGDNVWSLGDLAVGAWREITVNGTVSPTATDGTLLVNRVRAEADNADPSEDEEITLVLDDPPPPPEIFKTVSTALALPGQALVYTITVQNVSAFVVPNASVVETYDPLFIYGSAVPAPVPGTDNLWDLGDLAPNSAVQIVITGTVSPAFATTAVLFNTAELFTDFGSRTVHAVTLAVQPATVGDRVWDDLNGNGIQDPGEPGIPNATVQLYSATSNLVATTTTDADGLYAFTNLPPATYFLHFARPAGFQRTPRDRGGNDALDSDASTVDGNTVPFVLAAGQNASIWDAGFYRPASVGDYIWLDEDWDGQQDAGEPGIQNVRMQLLNSNGTVIATTLTDVNGLYLFSGLAPATYTVRVDTSTLAAGLAANQTYDPDGVRDHRTAVTLSSGAAVLTADFGYNWSPSTSAKGAIGDRVWVDANANGIQDPGEPGIPGVRLRLYADANGDGNYNSQVGSVLTDAAGGYVFSGLNPGAYVVRVDTNTLPANFIQTGDPDYFGEAVPAGQGDHRTTTPILLSPGDVFVNADFGYWFPNGSSIGDLVFFDANASGAYHPPSGEYGIPGVTVVLLRNGVIIASTITDANGWYLFTGLPAGTYTVWVNDSAHVLANLVPTADPDGGFDNRSTVTVNGIQNNLLQDFGYAPDGQEPGLGLIGDTIFLDGDGDGQPGAGEGIQGVTVHLTDASGANLLATTFTDPNGRYYFGGLAAGTYGVRVATNTLPNGGAGLRNTVDPDTPNPGNSRSTVTIGTGGINLLQDFGYVALLPNTISGTLWRDCNADGILDADETPRWEGVKLVLRNSSSNIVGSTFTDASGNYRFTGLPDGTYTVDVQDVNNVLNGFWHSRGPNPGANNNSQADPYTVTVAGGASNSTGDFGYYLVIAELGDYVWYDINGNGLQDGGEPGLANVQVTLTIRYPNGSQTKMVTRTDSSGRYRFANLLLDERYRESTLGNPATTGLPRFQISIVATQPC